MGARAMASFSSGTAALMARPSLRTGAAGQRGSRRVHAAAAAQGRRRQRTVGRSAGDRICAPLARKVLANDERHKNEKVVGAAAQARRPVHNRACGAAGQTARVNAEGLAGIASAWQPRTGLRRGRHNACRPLPACTQQSHDNAQPQAPRRAHCTAGLARCGWGWRPAGARRSRWTFCGVGWGVVRQGRVGGCVAAQVAAGVLGGAAQGAAEGQQLHQRQRRRTGTCGRRAPDPRCGAPGQR